MKECYKNFIVGFVVVILCCGLIVLFCLKPGYLLLLVTFIVLSTFFWMCYAIGRVIRESCWYENLILYIKRMLNKQRKKVV